MRKEKRSSVVIHFTALFAVSLLLLGCGKSNPQKSQPSGEESNGLPGSNEPYISYYVANNKTVTNAYYTSATDIGKFIVTRSGDTSFFSLEFSNTPLSSDATRVNQFLLCDSAYDVNGTDAFAFFCRWTGGPLQKLTVGKVYNLNEIRDNNAVPVTGSNGVASFRHLHRNFSLVASLNTVSNIVEPEASNSYLQISKMVDGTVSGTFSLAFGCASGNSGNTVNYVKGIFNKIPFEE